MNANLCSRVEFSVYFINQNEGKLYIYGGRDGGIGGRERGREEGKGGIE